MTVEVFQVNPLSLKTKDKVKSKPLKLTKFDIPVPLKEEEARKVKEFERLHKISKILNKRKGRWVSKKLVL